MRITKSVFHAPAEAHPLIDQLAQGILFESQAKFDRMQAFLDKKKQTRRYRPRRSDQPAIRTAGTSAAPLVGVLGGGRMGAGIAHAFLINGANVLVVERDEDAAAGRPRTGRSPLRQEHRARRHRRQPR